MLPGIPFSTTSVETAKTIGVLPALATIASARNAGLPFEQLLLARQRVVEQITLAMLDISSVTAELDCENERGDQLRDQLQTLEQQRSRSLTVASLVLGAATAVVSGGITLAAPDAVSASVVNIAGGSAQAATGFAALGSTAKGRLMHERNLLTDLWQDRRESTMYPATVWRFLHRPRPGALSASLRDDLIAHWKSDVRLGETDPAGEQRRSQLIFGVGGEYGVDDLRARRAILDQLKATTRLLYQELELLLLEVSRKSAKDEPAGMPKGAPPGSATPAASRGALAQ